MMDCLTLVFNRMEHDFSYTISRTKVLSMLDEYFDNRLVEVDDSTQTTREKSRYVLSRFKECGWISEELNGNFGLDVVFQDYATEMMKTMLNLSNEVEVEYSGYVYAVYQSFKNFDINNGAKAIEQAHLNTVTLMTKLKALNANIKKYIQKLLNDQTKNDLNELLRLLLDDYQTKIIDRAYHNLTTKDHPAKYRMEITQSIQLIENNETLLDKVIIQIMDLKEMTYEEATRHLLNQTHYITSAFEQIIDVLDEIDSKNRKYVESAINRIKFLLNSDGDLEAKINRVLKAVIEGQSGTPFLRLSTNRNVDESSLYTPRKFVKREAVKLLEVEKLTEEEQLEEAEKLFKANVFSKVEINKYVLSKLGDKDEITSSEMPLATTEDYLFLIIAYLYGASEKMAYTVEETSRPVEHPTFKFTDYLIRRTK